MKNFIPYFLKLSVFSSIIALLLLAACGGDDPKPSAVEIVQQRLTSATWLLETVTVDGSNQTELYEGLTLTFTKSGYTSTGGEPVWQASGLWSFTDETALNILRDDGVNLTIVTLTDATLSIKLIWNDTTLGTGRSSSIAGEYVFTFRH
jgi:hypothetical protein